MATIQNDRDILLKAATVRVVPVQIPIEQVTGLPGVLDGINDELVSQSSQISSVMNNTKDLLIAASSTVFSGSSTGTTPATITLTAVLKNGLTGTVTWSVTAGSITISPSGNTCMLTGTTMLSQSVTIRARLVSGKTYDAFVTIARLGALASQNTVDLTSQVTGALNSGNITGLGALALLNTVNLNTQTVGALNGATQVTNLGSLAYANAIAANQIGAGQLAAGVVYAGTINANKINAGTLAAGVVYAGTISAEKINAGTLAAGVVYAGTISAEKINAGSFSGKDFTGGTFTGTTFKTNPSNVYPRVELNGGGAAGNIRVYNDVRDLSVEIYNNGIRAKAYDFSEAITISPGASSSSKANGMIVSVPGYGIQVDSPLCHIHLQPKSSFPPQQPVRGSVFMHLTHGLCISNGTQWLKTTWTPV